jgi:hypothetical protein
LDFFFFSLVIFIEQYSKAGVCYRRPLLNGCNLFCVDMPL